MDQNWCTHRNTVVAQPYSYVFQFSITISYDIAKRFFWGGDYFLLTHTVCTSPL